MSVLELECASQEQCPCALVWLPRAAAGAVPLALYPKDVYNAYSHSCLTFTVTHRRSYAYHRGTQSSGAGGHRPSRSGTDRGRYRRFCSIPSQDFASRRRHSSWRASFASLASPLQDGIALTGLKGMLETGNAGPTVAVMGELDSLKVLDHPHADPTTAAAHACGHHCQIAMMLAVGIGLKAAGVLPDLAGRVALLAVPAEEYIEIAYRDQLRREGKLEFLGGKPEFIRLGALDDVDLAMMTHTSSADRTRQDRLRRHEQWYRRQTYSLSRQGSACRWGTARRHQRAERRHDCHVCHPRPARDVPR